VESLQGGGGQHGLPQLVIQDVQLQADIFQLTSNLGMGSSCALLTLRPETLQSVLDNLVFSWNRSWWDGLRCRGLRSGLVSWRRGLETLVALGWLLLLLALVSLGSATMLAWDHGRLLVLLGLGWCWLEPTPPRYGSWGRFGSSKRMGDGVLASRGNSWLGCCWARYHHRRWVIPPCTTGHCWGEPWASLVRYMTLRRGQTGGGLAVGWGGFRSEHGGLSGSGVSIWGRLLWLHKL